MSNSSQITAEWVVRAQLTIHRPNADNNLNDPDNQCSNSQHMATAAKECFTAENPINVVYEWCSNNNNKNATDSSSIVGTILDAPKLSNFSSKDSCSFRSTGVTSNDSGFDTTKNHANDAVNNTKHSTTCNIILSALVHENPETANVITNHSTTFSNKEEKSAQNNVPAKNVLLMRDAYSQTSDTNIENTHDYGKVSNEFISNRISKERTNRRHSLESNLSRMGRLSPTIAPSLESILQTKPKKKPRTVHIDVYCTGSESESEDQSNNDIDPIQNLLNDLESNSTQQTVYNSNRMKLNHTRIKEANHLPRRIANNNQCHSMDCSRYATLREYFLAQPDPTDDEIYDSTHEVFINDSEMFENDQSTHSLNEITKQSNPSEIFNLLNDTSDNCISSNYPNSSRSTMRDLTCSSISSALANSSSANVFDIESSWKETQIDDMSNCPSDGGGDDVFNNPLPVHSTEKLWKSSNEIKANYNPLDRFEPISQPMKSTLPLKFEHLDIRNDVMRTEINHSKSVDYSLSSDQIKNGLQSDYNMFNKSNSLCPFISGYTREYLLKAQKFGTVIRGMKKPGHHVGPAKNPDCQCEYCRRWFSQRSYSRDRASSLDITFIDYSTAANSYNHRQNL